MKRLTIPDAEDKAPILLHHPTPRSIGYFGAVRLRDGKVMGRAQSRVFLGFSPSV
jgi:hypothetical protein